MTTSSATNSEAAMIDEPETSTTAAADIMTNTVTPPSKQSLLAQALSVPSLGHLVDGVAREAATTTTSTPTPNSMLSPPRSSPALEEILLLPQHSDFTIPTSNIRLAKAETKKSKAKGRQVEFAHPVAPPLSVTPPEQMDTPRRSVFGAAVGKRYVVDKQQLPAIQNGNHSDASWGTPPSSPTRSNYTIDATKNPLPAISPLTPAVGVLEEPSESVISDLKVAVVEELTVPVQQPKNKLLPQACCTAPSLNGDEETIYLHETIHAQSLILGLAFMAVWSPNNAMAPNLTQMAEDFGMNEAERDLYLGSYCALALGVFCLPLTALLGFMADFYNRKHLFLFCVIGGSLASAWTGWSRSVSSVFFARLVNGGCMSASVPVSFSLLGDLFSTEERNAASSGLTAMMGTGIVLGQVFAGMVGPTRGWSFPFFVSAALGLSAALSVLLWVREPDRGAKEAALKDLIQAGNKYDRQLTLQGFIHAMRHNRSNRILLWQGFLTSLPWGIVFVFLNDFLSQEKGFSVQEATLIVAIFGIGCAIGGISGGYIGQLCVDRDRRLLPLFMATTTFLGIAPFLGLLNSTFSWRIGYWIYSLLGGVIASLPSTSSRPCIINVNPPETRGAALTANSLLINLGRGIGPSCVTSMCSVFRMRRQTSFNITLTVFWTIAASQLLMLIQSLPKDQDAMDAELVRYAASQRQDEEANESDNEEAQPEEPDGTPTEGVETVLMSPSVPHDNLNGHRNLSSGSILEDGGESIVSIEEYMTSFDGRAARQSLQFMRLGIRELREEMTHLSHACNSCSNLPDSPNGDGSTENGVFDSTDLEEIIPQEELEKRREWWRRKRMSQDHSTANAPGTDTPANEETPLLRAM